MTNTRLIMAVQNCPKTLLRISQRISDPAFKTAYESYDINQVNAILEDAFCRRLGTDNLYAGLEQYARKFGIEGDFSNLNIDQCIDLIYEHRDMIDQKLKDSGV